MPKAIVVEFSVVGMPKGEPRARARVLGKHASVYSAKTADEWKFNVRGALVDTMTAQEAYMEWPIFDPKGPVALTVTFYMPRPKSHHVAGDKSRPLKDSAPLWCTSKPDNDNLLKAVADCLGPWPKGAQGLLWSDDQQVCAMECVKLYTREGQEPGAVITAHTLNPGVFPERAHETLREPQVTKS